MLRSLLLSSVSPAVLFAPPGDPPTGAAAAQSGNTAEGESGSTSGEGDPGVEPGEGDPDVEPGKGEPEAGAGEGEPGASGEGETDPEPKPDWRDREIARKHAQLQAEKRERARITQELADAKALLERGGKAPAEGDPAPRTAAPLSPDDPAVQRAAATLAAKASYDQQCDAAYSKGKEVYKDKWDPALERINVLGGLGDGAEGVEVMNGILATDDPAKVLFELGTKPDTYRRVMDLPPARRQTELVKLAMPGPKAKPKKPSGAPAPVEPLERRADARDDNFLYRDNVSDEDWYKFRQAQKARRFAEKGKGRAA